VVRRLRRRVFCVWRIHDGFGQNQTSEGMTMHMKADNLTAEQIGKMREEYILPSTMRYFPMNIVKGEMQFVYDDQGKKYLDGFSAVVTISVGHCHPEVTNPVIEQLKNLQHMTTLYYHPNLVRYAEKLASVMPDG